VLSGKTGLQRFVWDLKYAPPPAFSYGFPISANYLDTPLYPLGPAVLPGTYTVKLTVNGQTFTQSMSVKIDPRVKTSAADLAEQFKLSFEAYDGMQQTARAVDEAHKLRSQIKTLTEKAGATPIATELAAFDKSLAQIGGPGRGEAGSPGVPGGGAIDLRDINMTRLNNAYASILEQLQSADLPPTQTATTAAADLKKALTRVLSEWAELRGAKLAALNAHLRQAQLTELVP